jgi:hypothetical protein
MELVIPGCTHFETLLFAGHYARNIELNIGSLKQDVERLFVTNIGELVSTPSQSVTEDCHATVGWGTIWEITKENKPALIPFLIFQSIILQFILV